MRLICGLVRLDRSPASPELLNKMVAALGAPPTVARADYRQGPAALALLDYSAGATPSLPALGASHLAADVRLDEPEELAARLGLAGADQDQLLLEAASTPGMLPDVLGDFAFALWDAEAETLICARDNFGVRPFAYVHRPGELFAFASLPAALHGSGIVPDIVDREAAIRRTVGDFRFEDSIVEGISRLPPAHKLTVSRAGISIERYWQLDRTAVGTARLGPEQAAAELRRRVEQAVRSRTPPGVAVGSHLSGGLDSSAIAILAARNLREEGRRLPAWSFLDRLRNDVQLVDESDYVSACLQQEPDMDWQAIRSPGAIVGRDPPLDLDTMLPLTEDYPEARVARAAAAQGVQLILSGVGGDEAATFNGRGALPELLRRGRLRTVAREVRAVAREQEAGTWQVILRHLVIPLMPDRLLRLARAALEKPAPKADATSRAIKSREAGRLARGAEPLEVADGRETRWRLINHAHIAHQAETLAQIGARHGLAFAFPLLDRRVVEFALSLPSELFVRGGVRRRVFRDAMRGILPELVRTRPHKFPPFPGWLIDLADSRENLTERLAEYRANPRLAELIDFEVLDQLYAKFPTEAEARAYGNETHPDSGDVMAFVKAMTLAAYLSRAEDRGRSRDCR